MIALVHALAAETKAGKGRPRVNQADAWLLQELVPLAQALAGIC